MSEQSDQRFRRPRLRPDGTPVSPRELSSMRMIYERTYDESKLTPETITPQQYHAMENTPFNRGVKYFTRAALVVLPIALLLFITEDHYQPQGYTIFHVWVNWRDKKFDEFWGRRIKEDNE